MAREVLQLDGGGFELSLFFYYVFLSFWFFLGFYVFFGYFLSCLSGPHCVGIGFILNGMIDTVTYQSHIIPQVLSTECIWL